VAQGVGPVKPQDWKKSLWIYLHCIYSFKLVFRIIDKFGISKFFEPSFKELKITSLASYGRAQLWSQLFRSPKQEDLKFEASLDKVNKTLSQKQKYKHKGWGHGSSGRGLACMRPWVQSPIPKKP
jgi:hypothetical protein